MNLEQAIVALNQANLSVGDTEGDQTQGRVASQTPAAGTHVPAGTAVNLRLTRSGADGKTANKRRTSK